MSQRNSDKTISKKITTASTRPSVGNVSVINNNSLDVSNLVLNNQAISIEPESIAYLNVSTAGIAEPNKAVIVNSSNNIENLGDISTDELYVDGDLVTGVVNRGATVSDSIYMNNIQPGVSSPEKILSTSPSGEITANVQSDLVRYNGGEIKGRFNLNNNSSGHKDFVDLVNFYVRQTASSATFFVGQSNHFVYENLGQIMFSQHRTTSTATSFIVFQNPYIANGGTFNTSFQISSSTETHSYQCAYDSTLNIYMIPYTTTVSTTTTLNIRVSPNTDPSTWTNSTAWTVVSLPNTSTATASSFTPAIKWSSLLNQYVIFYVNTLYGSTNGTTWNVLSTTPVNMGFNSHMVVHPNYLLVVSVNNTTTYFTINGTNWTAKTFTTSPITATTDLPIYIPEVDVVNFKSGTVIIASTFLSLPSTNNVYITVVHTGLNNITGVNTTYLSNNNCYVWNTTSGIYNIYDISNKLLYTGTGSYYSGYINLGSYNTTTFADTRCWRYTINISKPTVIESYVDINPETFLNFENKNRSIIRDFEWVPAINKYVAIGFIDDAYNTAFYTNVCIYHSDDLETFTFVSDTGSTTVNKLCVNFANGYLYLYEIGTTTAFYAANYGINGVFSVNLSTVNGMFYIPDLSTIALQGTTTINVFVGSPTNPINTGNSISLSYAGSGASGNCIVNPDSLDIIFNPGTLRVSTDLITILFALTRAIDSNGNTSGFVGQSGYRNGFPGSISLNSTTTAVTESNSTVAFKRLSSYLNSSITKTNVSGSVFASIQYSNTEYIAPLGIFVAIRNGISYDTINRIVYSYDNKTWMEPAINSISANLINIKSSTLKYDSNSGYMYVLGSNGFFKTVHSTKKLNLEESILTKSQLSHFYARDNSGLELFPFSNIKSSDNTNTFNNGLTYSKGVYVSCCLNKLSVGSKIFNMVDTNLTGNWTSIASSLTHIIASGNGQIAVSSNLGVNFSAITTNISSHDWNFISYSDQVERWAMCSADAFAFSTDGTNWTTTALSGGNWKSIRYSNGFWLAVGLNRIAYATLNGAFTTITISGDWRDSAFGGQWIITGYGKTALSTNINSLVNWTTLTGANNKNFNSVVYIEGLRQFFLVGEHIAVYVQMNRTFFQPSNQILINTGESAWGVMKQCIWSDRYQAIICVGAGRSIIGSRIIGSGLDNSCFDVNSRLLSGYDSTLTNSYLNISDNSLTPTTADGQVTVRSNILTKPVITFKNNSDSLVASIDNNSTTNWGFNVPKCLSLEYSKYFRINSTTLAYDPTNLSYLSIEELGTSTPNTYITTDISGDIAAAGALNIGGLVLGNKIYSNTTPIIMQSVSNGIVSAGKACKLDSSKNLANVNVLSVDYLNIGVDTFKCIPVENVYSLYAHTQTSTECADNTVFDACYHSDLDIYVGASNMIEFTTGSNLERNYLLFSKDGINWNKCFTGLYANVNKIIPLYADASKNHFFISSTTVTTYIGFVIFATSTANNIGKIFFTPDLVNFYPLNVSGSASTHDTNYGTNSTIFFSDGLPSATTICNRSSSSPNKFFIGIDSSANGSAYTNTNMTDTTSIKYAICDFSNGFKLYGLSGNDLFELVAAGASTKTALGETANAMVIAKALSGNSTHWDYIVACSGGKIIYNTNPIITAMNNSAARTTLVIDALVNFTCCEYNFTTKRFLLGSTTGKIYISNAGSKTVWSLVSTPTWLNGTWNGIRSIGSKGFIIWHDDNGDNSKKNTKICRVDENNTFQLMYQSFERTLGLGCHAAGKYVIPEQAGGLSNKIMYSDDGINWKYTFETGESLQRVVYMTHLNLFVAMSGRSVFSSADGISWTLVYTNSNVSAIFTSALYASNRSLLVLTYRGVTTQNVITSSDLSQWNVYNYTSYLNIYYSEYSPLLDGFIFSPVDGNVLPAFYTTNFTNTTPCVSLDADSTLPNGRNLYWMQTSNVFLMGNNRWQSSDGINWKKVSGFLNYDTSTFSTLAGIPRNFVYVPNVGDITVNGFDTDGSYLVSVNNGIMKIVGVLGGGIKGDDYATIIYNSEDNKLLAYKNSTGSRKGEYFQLVDLEEYKQKNNKEIAVDYIDKVYSDRLSIDNYVGTSNIRTLVNSTLDGGLANQNAKASQMGTLVAGNTFTSSGWSAICWSPQLSIFVAVANTGVANNLVITSNDGDNWTFRTTPSSNEALRGVCWSPDLGLFAATGNGSVSKIMTSPDGINWTSRTAPTNTLAGICWSTELSLFVAVANAGTNRVITSSDGITWTYRLSAGESNSWQGICWSPELSLFVVVASSGTNKVMTSPDGINWTARLSAVEANGWNCVCWSPYLNLFVATANSGTNRIMVSTNGINWDSIPSPNESNAYISIIWSSRLEAFISGASSGSGMISYDGRTWSSFGTSGYVSDAPELNVLVYTGSTNMLRLFDFKSAVTYTNHIANNNNWNSICWAPSLNIFVGVAYAGTGNLKVATSSDGIEWIGRSASNNMNWWLSVCWSPELSLFVAVAGSGINRVMTSPNGITWTARLSAVETNGWNCVCWSSELTLFVATAISGTNRVMTSPDGINWTARTSATEANAWRSVCWSSTLGLFVAVADTGTNRVMTSSNGTSWIARTSSGETNTWQSVCWSPTLNIFAAIANTGTNRAMTSPDGTTWTARLTGNEQFTGSYSVIWSTELNMFIAPGGGLINTSIDGIYWFSRNWLYNGTSLSCAYSSTLGRLAVGSSTGANNGLRTIENLTNIYAAVNHSVSDNAPLSYICWSPQLSLFVAITTSSTQRIITSPNANAWTARTPSSTTNTWSAVCWSPQLTLFVAVASAGTTRVMTSPDGITWTGRTSSGESTAWQDVCWSPELGLFVAVATGGTNRVMFSSNGTNWTSTISSGESNTWQSVCWSPELSLFVAVANTGTNRVMTSPDGSSWTARTSSGESNTWFDVCWSPALGLFAAVSTTGTNRVMTSPDGINWTARTPEADANEWRSIAWSPELNLFAAVAIGSTASSNRIMFSSNGINWTGRATPNDTHQFQSICWSPLLESFVAVTTGSYRVHVFTRPSIGNGTTPLTNENCFAILGNQWQNVCWSPQLTLFVAVATGTGTNRVMTSPNGITWTARLSAVETNSWQSICWSPDLTLFVATAISGTNRVMTSPNGITWTARTSAGESNAWISVCWSPELGLFVAVADSGTNRVMTSDNGTIWTARVSATEANSWQSVCWSPYLNLFVAVANSGTNRVMTSSNGTSWTARSSATEANTWVSVCWSPYLNMFAAVSNTGTNRLMTSSDGINWTARAGATDAISWVRIVWVSGINLFIATSNQSITNGIMISSNGITWYNRSYAVANSFRCVTWAPEINTLSLVTSTNSLSTNTYRLSPVSITLSFTVNWDVFWSNPLQRFIAYKKVDPIVNDTQIYLSKDGYSWNFDATSYTAINAANRLKAVASYCEVPFLDAIYTCRNTAFVQSLTPIGVVETAVTGNTSALFYSNTLKCLIIGRSSSNSIAMAMPTKTGTITNIITYTLPATITVSQILSCANNHLIIQSDSTSSYYYSTNMNVFSTGTLPSTGVWKFVARNIRGYYKRVVGVNNLGVIIYSDNGINWTTAMTYTPSTRSFINVKYIQEFDAFVAVDSISKTNAAVYSFDGITWTDIVFSSSVSLCDCDYSPSSDNFVFISTGTELATTIITLPKIASSGNIISYDTRSIVASNISNIFNLNSKGGIYTGNFTDNTFNSAETENVPLLALHTDSAYKPTNSAWTIQSDSRIKHDIENADLDQCFNNIKELDLKHYNWKEEFLTQTGEVDRSRLGWIAQDVEKILPKSIVEMGSMYGLENIKTLNQDQIVAMMYGAVQKLMQKYEALQAELDSLE